MFGFNVCQRITLLTIILIIKRCICWSDYVSPPYRGKRIHRALLSYMFKYLQNQGYNTAWTSVWLNNTPSIRGLMAVGYEPRFQITAVRVFKRLVYKKIKTRDSW